VTHRGQRIKLHCPPWGDEVGPGNRGSLDGPEWGRSDGRRRRRDAESSLFRTLLDQTETAIFATDAEGRYLYKSDLNVDIDPSRAVGRTEVEAKPEYLRETAETDWEDDEIRGLVGIRTDTTREKLAEKRLRRQADQVDRFARQVTHNVRTPLQMADSALDRARAGDETALDAVEQRLHETETVVDDLHLVSADDTREVSVGLVVCGHTTKTTCEATFSEVRACELEE
jgi:signal transduction histidine kinase